MTACRGECTQQTLSDIYKHTNAVDMRESQMQRQTPHQRTVLRRQRCNPRQHSLHYCSLPCCALPWQLPGQQRSAQHWDPRLGPALARGGCSADAGSAAIRWSLSLHAAPSCTRGDLQVPHCKAVRALRLHPHCNGTCGVGLHGWDGSGQEIQPYIRVFRSSVARIVCHHRHQPQSHNDAGCKKEAQKEIGLAWDGYRLLI